jgi:hypothetical protein
MPRRMISITAIVAAGVAAMPATADAADYVARTVTEPATSGLPVTGPLSNLRAVSRARVIVPTEWRPLRSPRPGALRLITPGGRCRYVVTFETTGVVGDAGDASAYAEAALPTPGPRRLLDSGIRGASAFRVVRPASSGGIRLDAIRAAVLTRRADVASAGKVVWSELRASAMSRPGDECHAGSYRARGPQLGDALAVARTSLRFLPAG